MQSVKLSQLIHGKEIDFVTSNNHFQKAFVASISLDSRSLKKAEVFIAIPGEKFDGHSFIEDVLKKGASCVIFEIGKIDSVKTYFINYPSCLFIGVNNTRKLLGSIAKRYLALFDVRKLVITGSCGKTTTKGIVSRVLSQKYRVVASRQSYNNDIGVPKTIFNINGKTDFLIQEFGTNSPGEIEYLSDIVEQDNALITNIGPAHIGFFGSVQNIVREKKAALSRLDESGVAFLNAEDSHYHDLTENIRSKVRSFGLKKGDLFPEKILDISLEKTDFILCGERMSAYVTGVHGVLNATAAALVGQHFGISAGEIKRGIEGFRSESGRGRLISKGGITVIDESYNANPLSVEVALSHLSELKVQGRKVFVFADMLELGEKSEYYHRAMADPILKSGVKALFTYGDFAAVTARTCEEKGLEFVTRSTDINGLKDRLRHYLNRDDLVLVKGSRAMKLERIFEIFSS
ncbi:MAG: UDP-N-acetylmuramoyl-tripeptide--D-alanyl-D-alanine ligase [Spirochaetota bacterium]|nr:MAG: UDP-N-acetylmuramoyl-tripeptide--D-alanyl-D-alanine ligase [Spirochaetota bacterium]